MSQLLRVPGMLIREHTVTVPLDHARPDGETIEIFAREVADLDGGERPFLLYLQGGPGYESPRPVRTSGSPGWLERALADFRVLLLDQRGTGRSSPIGVLDELSAHEQADRLTHFRADAIVRDAECLREALAVESWSVLGQSFGGLCALAYLSHAPGSLHEVFLTGGLPGLGTPVDEVYRLTYLRTLAANRRLLARYPEDGRRLRELRAALERTPVHLSSGERLSWRRLRQIGDAMGTSGGLERVHYLLELDPLSPAFVRDVEQVLDFARNPLYAILHEACWADGGTTSWSAERMLPEEIEAEGLLTGEHVFPWMFEEIAALRPLRAAAQLLADHEWPALYDPAILATNEVPVAAAIYLDDMYVPRELSEATAAQIPNLRAWITNEYDHDGLHAAGKHVLGRLIDLARGRI